MSKISKRWAEGVGERKWLSNVGWSKVGNAVYCLVVKGLCNNNVLKYSSS
jgi:hypothetical protein